MRRTLYALTMVSRNSKTGPMPVSTSTEKTCPSSCPLKGNGCYAETGPLKVFWDSVTAGFYGHDWQSFLRAVRRIPRMRIWRHNQAGDLPGRGDTINAKMLRELVEASKHTRGFTYTHKPMTKANAKVVREANDAGFTINLSADNLAEADSLANTGAGPVVVVLPSDFKDANLCTPEGRLVVVCPAYRKEMQCVDCGMCGAANRAFIIGFPAHGSRKSLVNEVARDETP